MLWENGYLTTRELKIIEVFAEVFGTGRYKTIFFIRPVIKPKNFRKIAFFDEKAQKEIDIILEEIFKEKKIPYIEITEKDLEERVKFVAGTLALFGKYRTNIRFLTAKNSNV